METKALEIRSEVELMEAEEVDPIWSALASEDLRQIAREMDREEVRQVVGMYYRIQKERIANNNRTKMLVRAGKSSKLSAWITGQFKLQEKTIQKVVDYYTHLHTPTHWARLQVGIGPVLAAGFYAFLDLNVTTTPSKWWRFAGLDPTCKWEKGQKRPWNARLKTIAFLAGESFVKFQHNSRCFYGHLFRWRKALEWERNLRGEYREQALSNAERVSRSTETYKWNIGAYKGYEVKDGIIRGIEAEEGEGVPMLAPGHIHARARRWATKIFMVHFWMVAYAAEKGEMPPKPWVIDKGQHKDFIPIPEIDFSLDDYAALAGAETNPVVIATKLAMRPRSSR